MKKVIAAGAALSFVFGVICLGFYIYFMTEVLFSLTVTFFTVFYHFAMRIIVGLAVTLCRKNKTDTALFEIGDTERVFYDKIKLKRWKKYAPTYNPKLFSLKNNSYSELMHNMNNSRIGHEIIVLLSFVPILFSACIDGTIPFTATSVASALFDMQFVIIQRYNMARLSRIFTKNKDFKRE